MRKSIKVRLPVTRIGDTLNSLNVLTGRGRNTWAGAFQLFNQSVTDSRHNDGIRETMTSDRGRL